VKEEGEINAAANKEKRGAFFRKKKEHCFGREKDPTQGERTSLDNKKKKKTMERVF